MSIEYDAIFEYPVENTITVDKLRGATMHGFQENMNDKSKTSSILRYVDNQSFNINTSEQEYNPQNPTGAEAALAAGIFLAFYFFFGGEGGIKL